MNRQQQKPTQLNEDGKLVRPDAGFKSMIRLILRKPIAEKDAVRIIWAIGVVFGIIGILVALIMPGALENQTLVNFLQIKEQSNCSSVFFSSDYCCNHHKNLRTGTNRNGCNARDSPN